MKNIILLLIAFVTYAPQIFAQVPIKTPLQSLAIHHNENASSVQWESNVHDFGTIVKGKPVTMEFTFINTGKTPVTIASVSSSCGCTTSDYSKEPIAPGKKGFVKATYNAASVGIFNKTVTVNSNSEDGPSTLTIRGEVVEKMN